MIRRDILIVISWCAVSTVALADGPPGSRDFLKAHCFDCHQGSDAEAGLDLSTLSTDFTTGTFDKWVYVFDRVKAGEMPPKDATPPPADDVTSFLHSSSQWLTQYERGKQAKLGRVRGRRLTNRQLERTLQDLLGVDIPLARRMPDEPRTDGFTTVAAGQSISHFQLQTHLSVIDAALDEAIRRATTEPDEWTKTFSADKIARQNPKRRCREPEMLDGHAVVWSGRTTFYGQLPVTMAREDGWYRIKLKASALNVPEKHGVWCTVRTGACVSSAPLLAWSGAFEAVEKPLEWRFEAWLPKGHMFEIRPGDATLKVAKFEGGQIGAGEGTPQKVPGLAMHRLELERIHHGPDNDTIRNGLFDDLTVKNNKRGNNPQLVSTAPKKDATALMNSFAERAFRRPVAADIVAPYVKIVHESLANGETLLSALQGGYRAILCSPRFLHFQEQPGKLDDFAVASRLSYLLWSSMPDQELMTLATSGKLQDAEVVRQQVSRLLKDPRGQNFVRDFAYEWLDLSEIDFTEPDRKLYPGFDLIVQQSMLDETHAYLQEMLDRDQSVSHLIDSKFTFLNSRLARYYGIDRVSGGFLRRVGLRSENKRGGLLTHGAIMKVTANGTTTSPVLRGVWLCERLLGIDVPPPPAGVPAIEPDIRGATTIREMLEKHKSDASCASCHVKIDPPGFALENFDPSGRWRDRYPSMVKGKKSSREQIRYQQANFSAAKRSRLCRNFRSWCLRTRLPSPTTLFESC